MRRELLDYLKRSGYSVEDEGNDVLDEDDDYPQFAAKVVAKVLSSTDPDPRGILLCKGAQGMAMAANRFKGIRASVVWDVHEAQTTRIDNDSNVLCLPARVLGRNIKSSAQDIVDVWLKTHFSSATRHHRRIRELDELG